MTDEEYEFIQKLLSTSGQPTTIDIPSPFGCPECKESAWIRMTGKDFFLLCPDPCGGVWTIEKGSEDRKSISDWLSDFASKLERKPDGH